MGGLPLHLNFSWVAMLAAIICIFIGLHILLQRILNQSTRLKQEISQYRVTDDLLKFQANHDPLTGLVNRRELERQAEILLNTAKQNSANHALCMMDLDKFKLVNDTCGHAAGDEMLRQFSGLLKKTIRQRDTLGRLGGDEFGILIEHLTSLVRH